MAIVPGGRGKGWVMTVRSLLMLFMLGFLSNSQRSQPLQARPAGEERKGPGRLAEVPCRVFAARLCCLVHLSIPRGGVHVFRQLLALPGPQTAGATAPRSCLAFPAAAACSHEGTVYLEQRETLEK